MTKSRQSKRGTTTARIVFLIYVGVLLYLCFGHFDHLPSVSRTIWNIPTDKIVHFCMFFPFCTLSYMAVGKSPDSPWTAILLILALFIVGCILAAATEIGQGYTSWRSADPLDFRADTISLAIGSLITLVFDLCRRARR